MLERSQSEVRVVRLSVRAEVATDGPSTDLLTAKVFDALTWVEGVGRIDIDTCNMDSDPGDCNDATGYSHE